VRSRLTWLPQPAPAASQRPAPTFPLLHPIGGNLDDEASTRIRVLHPSGLPRPVIRGWNADPWAYSSGFAPRSYPRRTPGRRQSTGHWTGSHPRQTTSNRCDHSLRATSRRTTALSSYQVAATNWREGLTPPLVHRRLTAHQRLVAHTNSTYRRRRKIVSRWKKSQASSPSAWARRKVRRDVSAFRGAGPCPWARRMRRTVDSPSR
jgi:hypothetical protein